MEFFNVFIMRNENNPPPPPTINFFFFLEGEENTNIPFYSRIDVSWGRFSLFVGVTFMTLTAWFVPDFIHETVDKIIFKMGFSLLSNINFQWG